MIGFDHLGTLGQLGNQMFQYAATLGIARQIGVPFTIPNHDQVVVDVLGNRLRIELFDCFDIKPDKVGLLGTNNVLSERGFEFDRNVFLASNQFNFTLYGFFSDREIFPTWC